MTIYFFFRMWLNFCLSLSLTCAMFISVPSLLYKNDLYSYMYIYLCFKTKDWI